MKKKGISLVALVVTIIVLIILTGAVIATFMEGGIIDKAKQAVMLSDYTTLVEAYNVAYNTAKIDEVTGTGEKVNKIETLEKVVNELGLKGFSFDEAKTEVEYKGDNNEILTWINENFKYEVISKLGYKFSNIRGKVYLTGFKVEAGLVYGTELMNNLGDGYTIEQIEEGVYEEEGLITTGDKIYDKNGNLISTVVIIGDINGDFGIDFGDISFIELILEEGNGTELQLIAADINQDGYITIEDKDLLFSNMSSINQDITITDIPTILNE